jgi:hypothetical protein
MNFLLLDINGSFNTIINYRISQLEYSSGAAVERYYLPFQALEIEAREGPGMFLSAET